MKKKGKTARKKTYRAGGFTFITYLFFAVFVGMVAYFAYFVSIQSQDFINSPYNGLQDVLAEHITRGDIVTSDGYVVATTKSGSDGKEQRVYPYKNVFAHAIGYNVNGKAGLENEMNFYMLRSHDFFLTQFVNDLEGKKNQGDTVVSTLSYELQSVAHKALGNYDGAVIAMEASTGRVLCMVSKPDFDPNKVSQNWDEINADGSTVLYNRASQGQYAPGSVFKIFTALEYMREHPGDYSSYTFDCDGEFTSGDKTIHCAGNKSHGEEGLEESFAHSCNSSFASLGLSLDQNRFMELLNGMMFNRALPGKMISNSSKVEISNQDTDAMIMETAIGQGTTFVSPLHMALVAAAVDNGGNVMTPYMVDSVKNKNGTEIKKYKPELYQSIMTKEEAEQLKDYMRAVVSYGTAASLGKNSYDAYGKTGTAQVSDSSEQTNAWFVGFAEKQGYEDIAIAVVVEDSGAGSTYAVPVAQKLFDAYFN